ncbi:MAG TPA: MAPEG family protein [Steroidobacteraceae bacterium]|nr:MAPEG family protein [Steroidobacteraceae bacterium]
MTLVNVVLLLALVEFVVILMAVGRARDTYKVPAPATTGNEVFERYCRVQNNTVEQLIVFVPSLLLFAHYTSWPRVAAGLGLLFVIGRWVYFTGYVKDPKKRSAGFLVSFVPNMILLLGALIGSVIALVRFGLY